MTALIIIMDITILIVAFSFAIIPYVTRRTENFGVSIPENEYGNDDFRKMRRVFAVSSIAAGIFFSLAINGLLSVYGENTVIISLAVLLETAVLFLIYYALHRKMSAYKENAPWRDHISEQIYVQLAEPPEITKKPASPLWFAAYGLIIAVSIAVTLYAYPQLPDMIPIHFDLAGNADGYAVKSFWTVMFMPGILIFIALTFVLVYIIVIKSKRKIDAENPRESAARVSAFRAVWINFAVYSGLLLLASMALLHVAMLGLFPVPIATYAILGVCLAMIVWSVYLSFKYGQGGSRLDRGREKGRKLNAGDDDRHWIAGIIYNNKEDPALFVEKRFGVGFTVNIAKPVIWVAIAGILAACVWIIVLSISL